MKYLLSFAIFLSFLFLLSCNGNRAVTTDAGVNLAKYGVLPNWYGMLTTANNNHSGLCPKKGCTSDIEPGGSACDSTFIGVVGVDDIKQINGYDPSDADIHAGNVGNNPTSQPHTHIYYHVEKVIMGDQADFETKALWQWGRYDLKTGLLMESCGLCEGPVWPGERGVVYALTGGGHSAKEAFMWVMLPFEAEDTIDSRPVGGGKTYSFNDLISAIKSWMDSFCPEKSGSFK